MDSNQAFLSNWVLAEVLAPACYCGSKRVGCGYEGCLDPRLMDGWLQADGTWELWCDGRAIAAISADREIRMWPHLAGRKLKVRPKTVESGMRHVFRWVAARAAASGLLED